ncbi:MAG TPA: nuclear transport factor 2 family protein [Pseudonocardiaceae bacterium]|nr:nuclear transport factor 2 family protein [Pseudonocardiaceae bacterium]
MSASQTQASPRAVLRRYHRAMLAKSADDLADLYAIDAVHEFPFAFPAFPERYLGRAEIRVGYRAAWQDHPVDITEITEVVTYSAEDPAVVIADHAISGTVRATGAPFNLRGLLILEVHDGLITHARDYMDALSVMGQLGGLVDRPDPVHAD